MSKGAVFWHQGLFLQPQHFQCTDARTEALLSDLAGLARPWPWGVRRVSLDAGALAAGTAALSEFSGIFPGTGVFLNIPENTVCAARVIPENLVPVGDSLDVWLALPVMRPEGANAALADNAEELAALACRYGVPTGQDALPDLYENGPPAQARRMTTVLRLVFGPEKEQRADAALMRVGRLKRGGERYSLDESYAPPCLSLEDSPALSAIFREVRDRVIGKTRQMDSYKGLGNRGNQGELAALFMILRSLSRFSARLEFFSETRAIAPWEAYLLLREIVAELSVFSREFNPLGEDADGRSHILPYDHQDPASSFRALHALIVRLIEGLSSGPKYMIRLEPRPPFWQSAIPAHMFDDAKGSATFWILLHSPGANLEAMEENLRGSAKIGPIESMGALLAHAVPGLPFTVEENAPLGMARQSGAVYLALHDDSPIWRDVVKQGGICLDWTEAPSDLEAHFVVLGR